MERSWAWSAILPASASQTYFLAKLLFEIKVSRIHVERAFFSCFAVRLKAIFSSSVARKLIGTRASPFGFGGLPGLRFFIAKV